MFMNILCAEKGIHFLTRVNVLRQLQIKFDTARLQTSQAHKTFRFHVIPLFFKEILSTAAAAAD